jgi:hypothetical protein
MVIDMHQRERTAKQHISKPDILLIVFFIGLAVLLEVWMLFGRQSGTMVEISYDGSKLYTLRLEQSAKEQRFCLITYPVTSENGSDPLVSFSSAIPECPTDISYNLLSIHDGKVTMEAADCHDQICVHHIPISGSNESIICLPHKLVVTVTGGQDEDTALDGVAK